ncbi:MAG: NAD-dependent epimerase/dehydratase family protein [Cyanobacteria bacterium J06626_18]
MKALVTGANGFTGSHLMRALEARGDIVVGLVRQTSHLSRLADSNLQLVYGDITDRTVLKTAMDGVDTVFHTAACVDLGTVDEAEMERVNVDGTRAVLEVAQAASVQKLIYCSTIGVLGDTQGQVVDETYQRTQKDFSSAYDRTKYEAQQWVDRFAAQGLPVVSILPAGILGTDDPHFGPVFRLFLSGRLKLWPGGDRMTGIVHVDDLVAAMLLAAAKGTPGDRFIISTGELKTREMFACIGEMTGVSVPADAPEWLIRLVGNLLDPIGQLTGWNLPLNRERVHYIYDRCVRVDAKKAREVLGWQPRSIEETLRSALPSD